MKSSEKGGLKLLPWRQGWREDDTRRLAAVGMSCLTPVARRFPAAAPRQHAELGRTGEVSGPPQQRRERHSQERTLSRKVSPHAPRLRTRPHPTIIHHFPHFPRSRARPPPPLLPIPPSLPCASTPCSPPPCMRTRSTFLPPQVHPPPHPCFPRANSRPRRLGLHAHAALVLPDAQVEEAKNEEAAILPPPLPPYPPPPPPPP